MARRREWVGLDEPTPGRDPKMRDLRNRLTAKRFEAI